MKHFGLLCIFLILIHFSTQIPKFENCPESVTKTFNTCECCTVKCSAEGTEMQALACPLSHCAGTQIGYHEDKTKVYPDCCGHPICKEE
ncbi:hypothetical protein ALC60_13557 [Trachymyrmex zeteki]|uniref:Single domain-containing protein n=1 Tax=Mycetomoellerius zeteki TaxID=64791 RepID=A0A151WHX0_9HYME|nr:PREDICTED: uncharacterized protein LOC108729897 [Trachymyrmex zeteki]KYQ47436.1 hypothetical protein ALC60_13557 [Trachymyrmex zeteki]